jgi:transcription elongation factor Elf1
MVVGKYLRASMNTKRTINKLEDATMGRRRKKVVHIPKKRLPKFFSCPRCGKETVRVEILREENRAIVGCSSCGLQEEFPIKQAQGEVDIYCLFTDKIYGTSRRSVPLKGT